MHHDTQSLALDNASSVSRRVTTSIFFIADMSAMNSRAAGSSNMRESKQSGFMIAEEADLVAGARRGDVDAFRRLVEHHQKRAFAVAVGILHDSDDARDVCQEAFIRAYKNLSTFEGSSQFFTWLYQIVRNLCIDHLRKRRGEKVAFDEEHPPGAEADDTGIAPRRLGFDPDRALADKQLRARLRDALGRLSPPQRAVIVMRELEGLSYREMAEAMDCSVGTIMSRLFHARKRMQSMLLEAA